MSTLTLTLLIMGVALIVFFVLVEFAYRLRFGHFPLGSSMGYKDRVPADQIVMIALMVAAFVVGDAAPKVAPASAFARWLLGPCAQMVYFAWCILAPALLRIVFALIARRRRREAARAGIDA